MKNDGKIDHRPAGGGKVYEAEWPGKAVHTGIHHRKAGPEGSEGKGMNEFYVAPDFHPTEDDIVRSCLGISLDQLVMDIIENRDGKYDSLYQQATTTN